MKEVRKNNFNLEHLGQAIQLLGGEFSQTLTRRNTHLISSSLSSESAKFLKAKEWGLVVVDHCWVYECIEKVRNNRLLTQEDTGRR